MDLARAPAGDIRDLFPGIEPYITGILAVGTTHRLYWEECGRPDGIPAVFLHGGPGAGCTPTHRRFFDPETWRLILFDQRGAGRSRPTASIEDNTTQHLIADMEALRIDRGIDRWMVFGGSWGSTLALAYAMTHPERVLGLVLRGIFLCRPQEVDWFLYGMGQFFPEAHATFVAPIPQAERGDLLKAYYKRLIDPVPETHMPYARVWSAYETACSTLLPNGRPHSSDDIALSLARLEAHYMINLGFLAEGELLRGVDKLRHLPCTIVHGRYDAICPIATAAALSRAWPEAEYVVVPDAGHSAIEPGIRTALVAATERMKAKLR
ncbi:MAG: prolyl aminopeptidase [Alphaproteobacteria bacterium]